MAKRKVLSEAEQKALPKEAIKALISNASKLELKFWIDLIMQNQTYDEVEDETTKEHNGIGLNAFDAGFITELYNQMQQGKQITEGQAGTARKKLTKYAGQFNRVFVQAIEQKEQAIPA